jgi:hypothetical protein
MDVFDRVGGGVGKAGVRVGQLKYLSSGLVGITYMYERYSVLAQPVPLNLFESVQSSVK